MLLAVILYSHTITPATIALCHGDILVPGLVVNRQMIIKLLQVPILGKSQIVLALFKANMAAADNLTAIKR